jgi:hypothetical protein
MPKVKYVGLKPVKTDNVALTGAIWNGNGDIQDVSAAAWEKLAKHPDIWELVKEDSKPSLSNSIPAPDAVAIADIVRKKPGPKAKVAE